MYSDTETEKKATVRVTHPHEVTRLQITVTSYNYYIEGESCE